MDEKFFASRMPRVELICKNCGIKVVFTNAIYTKGDLENFECMLCRLFKKGYMVFGMQNGNEQFFLPVGVN